MQENTIFVDNPTGPTTIIINDHCNPIVSLGDNGDLREDSAEPLQDEDAGDTTNPKPMTTGASAAGDQVPTDIAAGPSQNPVQPKIKFSITLKGRKHRSFNSDWYKQYRWLEYSRGRDAAYCYPCRLFTTESGRYSETFTKNGFCDWKHACNGKGWDYSMS